MILEQEKIKFELFTVDEQYDPEITLETDMHCNFKNSNLELEEMYREIYSDACGEPVYFGEFLEEFASFLKISNHVYLIGNKGTGIFDINGFIKKKSELKGKECDDSKEAYGNFVCVLVLVDNDRKDSNSKLSLVREIIGVMDKFIKNRDTSLRKINLNSDGIPIACSKKTK